MTSKKPDLVLTKKDEVYAKILCEPNIAQELSEYFTFYVPGYRFTPAFKAGHWDGKIRLLSLKTRQIYLGLLYYIEEFCTERGYNLQYDSTHPELEDEFSMYHTKKFFDLLDIHADGKKLLSRDYQLDAFQHAMQRRRTLLVSPTASGKSLIIYMLFRQLLDYQNLKGLIIVPTTQLVEQLYTDFVDYSTNNKFDVEANVHRVYEGKSKESAKKLIISTWQSQYQLPESVFKQYDYVIGDEAHLFKAQSLTTIMTSCTNTKYRIGLTGTLDGTKTHKLVLEGLFGTHRKVITTKELIDRKQLSNFTIKCLMLKHPDEAAKIVKSKKIFQDEIDYLIRCESRNRFVRNLAISLTNNTLVLYQFVEKHGSVLYDLIRNTHNLGDRQVFFIHGGVETENREHVRHIMNEKNNVIVVASFGTFSTGINIPNLHNLILASPAKSRIRNLQSIGRSLRLFSGKDVATLYDIADDLSVGNHMNFTLKHFLERVSIYNEEKFPFKIYKIGLKNDRRSDTH